MRYLVCIMTLLIVGCSKNTVTSSVDIRSAMQEAYENTMKNNIQPVRKYSVLHIGRIQSKGKTYHVAHVIHIQGTPVDPKKHIKYLAFFDKNMNYICKVLIDPNPLWCDGSKIYLFGEQECEGMKGNIWDFSEGLEPGKRKLESATQKEIYSRLK